MACPCPYLCLVGALVRAFFFWALSPSRSCEVTNPSTSVPLTQVGFFVYGPVRDVEPLTGDTAEVPGLKVLESEEQANLYTSSP